MKKIVADALFGYFVAVGFLVVAWTVVGSFVYLELFDIFAEDQSDVRGVISFLSLAGVLFAMRNIP